MKWTLADGYCLDDVLLMLSADRDVYALERGEDGQYHFVQTDTWDPKRHILGAYRPVEPLKSLLFRPREYLGKWAESEQPPVTRETIVFGVKACDLSSLVVQDHVFLNGGFTDPCYAQARERTILVTCDCTDFLEVCFCPVVGEQPYPLQGFDINISTTPQGDVLESGSKRGEELLEEAQRCLKSAEQALIEAVEEQRAALYQRLVDHQAQSSGLTPGMDLRAGVQSSFDSKLWADFAVDCVECGACNFICCTCHCFMLADGLNADGEPARTKQWDACLFANFALTGAGGNPRPTRASRLRNRFDKKFIFFPQILGKYACEGCGRCTEACVGKIDIRSVLKRAVDESNAIQPDTGAD
jgi:sulfhydrogenase subunit beta (sulfur reductase)